MHKVNAAIIQKEKMLNRIKFRQIKSKRRKKRLDELAMITELQLFKGPKNTVSYNNSQKIEKNKMVLNILKRHKKENGNKFHTETDPRKMKITDIEIEFDEHNKIILNNKAKSSKNSESLKPYKRTSILEVISNKQQEPKGYVIDELNRFVSDIANKNYPDKLAKIQLKKKDSSKMRQISCLIFREIHQLPLGKFRTPNLYPKNSTEFVSDYRKIRDTVKERMLLCQEIDKMIKKKKGISYKFQNQSYHFTLNNPGVKTIKPSQITYSKRQKSKIMQHQEAQKMRGLSLKKSVNNMIKIPNLKIGLHSTRSIPSKKISNSSREKSLSLDINIAPCGLLWSARLILICATINIIKS
ncbi:unnamed protein product [Moneuplotes crassus]|uniref:Uncharacterized protein n=1 Tax=Euplotes crassus TaxID=5936 RepID=A0AAD1XCX0_EUPCR|nr:unnamed protein product [Moneuplotes crassus]